MASTSARNPYDLSGLPDDRSDCFPRILLDTDMMTDCDDCLALGLLHRLADLGEAEILGVMVSSRHPDSALTVDRINTYYGRGDLPLARPCDGSGYTTDKSCFISQVREAFPGQYASIDQVPDAVTMSRRILSAQPHRSVTLVTIGYQSNLADLLKSAADEVSPLAGPDLVRRKVAAWVCMGGNFPVDDAQANVNFTRDPEAAYFTLTHWPAPVVFVGREIGHRIYTGDFLKAADESNPVRMAYRLHRGRGGPDASWDHHTADPCTILYAVRGAGNYWSVCSRGGIDLKPDCSFEWKAEIESDQAYLKQVMSRSRVAEIIVRIMQSSSPCRSRAGEGTGAP